MTQSFINAQNAQIQAKAAIDGSQQSYTNYQAAVLNTQIAQNNLNSATKNVVSAQTALDAATNQSASDQKAAGDVIDGVMKNVLKPMPATLKIINDDFADLGISAKGMGVNMNDATSILGSVGVTTDDTSKKTTALITAYQNLGTAANDTLPMDDALWNAISGSLDKISQVNLPLVISLYNQRIAQQTTLGANEASILATQNQEYATEIKRATAQGDLAKAAALTVQEFQNQYNAAVQMDQPLGDQLAALQKVYHAGDHQRRKDRRGRQRASG